MEEKDITGKNITVKVVYLEGQQRTERLKEIFASTDDQFIDREWTKSLQKPKLQANLKDFLARDSDGTRGLVDLSKRSEQITANELSFAKFQELLERVHNEVLRATLYSTNKQLSIHFWLVDNTQAIFSIPSVGSPEIGFQTWDLGLIKAFRELCKRYIPSDSDSGET